MQVLITYFDEAIKCSLIFFTESSASLQILEDKKSLLAKIFSSERSKTFNDLSKSDQGIALAIADLRYCAEQTDTHIEFLENEIHFSHQALAAITAHSAKKLGLPFSYPSHTETDVSGVPGNKDFQLKYSWTLHGQKQKSEEG